MRALTHVEMRVRAWETVGKARVCVVGESEKERENERRYLVRLGHLGISSIRQFERSILQ